MKSRRLIHLVAALLLLIGQSLAVVHATHHELSGETPAHCEICTLAHASGVAPAKIIIPAAPQPDAPVSIGTVADLKLPRTSQPPPSRGPPLRFA